MNVLISGALVLYLINKSGSIAEGLSQKIDNSLGESIGKGITGIYKNGQKQVQSWAKAIKDARKK
jgi:hypothetical protein